MNGFETRLSDIDAVIVFSKEDMERLSQRNGPCAAKLRQNVGRMLQLLAMSLRSPASSPALKASAPPFKGMALARRFHLEPED